MKLKFVHIGIIIFILAVFTGIAKAQVISPILEVPPDLNDNISLSPVFSWDNPGGAAFFELVVYKNNENENIINVLTVSNSYCSPYVQLDPYTTYHWKVRAFSFVSNMDWSDVWEFTTGNGNNKPNGSNQLPKIYSLHQNYPNPFNPQTRIKFDLPIESNVKLTIFDITGKEVDVLVNGTLSAGSHEVSWNASKTGSGVYIYRLEAGSYKEIRKMIVVK